MNNNFEQSMISLISSAIQRRLIDLHTAIPAIVDSFDPLTLTCSCLIAIKRQTFDGESEAIEVIPKVPVIFPRSDNYSFYFPIKSGDTVQLIFNERSLDSFKLSSGSLQEPARVPRFFNYSDAVAIPSLVPMQKGMTNFNAFRRQSTSSFIAYAGGFIGIDSDGKIYLAKEDGTENEPLVLGNVLLAAFTDLYARMASIADNVKTIWDYMQSNPIGMGNLGAPVPAHPSFISQLSTSSADIETIKSSLEADEETYVNGLNSNLVSQIAFTERGGQLGD